MLHVLWYNWKDIKNPASGGAEVYTHQIAKQLVDRGREITLFVSEFSGSKNEQLNESVRVVRKGGKYGVYRAAKKFYETNQKRFDIVTD